MAKKLIAVVGATGNQGGSVARRFLAAGYRVRALTRDSASPSAAALAALGPDLELVHADLEDVVSLEEAFRGANAIFSVTNYWEPFFRPDCRAKAQEQGISCRRFAYDVEYRQGRNIADAAATTVESLDENGFLVSTLSHAARCSGGRFKELYHFDAKADIFPDYVNAKYPALAAKMSCIHTGFFYTSYRILPNSYFRKNPDDTFTMAFTTSPDKPIPHFAPASDMGNFSYAVSQMPPGKAYMAEGTTCTWPQFLKTWAKVTGVKADYKQISPEEMIEATGERDTGIEVAYMFSYSSDPGYDGGMDLLTAADLREAGIDCPMTAWEEWAKQNDWTSVLEK
ncbi:NmrA-like family protein [Colletotrichum graminicola]|uniref:NmrA-like family protein n=1 Tax=Colletotrichum graminicola (strain M1.001 / M2 / FGSC 10212) TaxID=645133 RepID=E3QJL8_COLGM|nr:NmrA-like family protein [Colletotrichum graminicola M1.001]EFQ31056.1 NmrA-like family protein [Colletotrichum graminicola M1.001]WDK17214.1 NmrA-like family protein [Colletotrichum graminicola]